MSDLEEQLDEDLHLIVKQLTHPTDIDRAALRVTASAITRKWFIDKNLVRLGRDLGMVPHLPAINTGPHEAAISNDKGFRFYTAGGAALDGRPLNSFYDHAAPRDEALAHILQVPRQKNFTVSKFLNRKCSYFFGTWIKTEDIIRYVANKIGGVHYDTTRDKFVHSAIDDARSYFLLGNNEILQPEDHKGPFVRIPVLPEGLWDFTQIEMLAVAQALCNVKFDGKPFMSFVNVEEPLDGEHDILLGMRNRVSLTIDEYEESGWSLPPNYKNETPPRK